MKRVLIIDDAATVRMYHRKILEDCGFEVDEAVNGLEALEKAFSTTYDLFIVDINMPKMDGYRFISELRAREELSQVPAIMVSTESETKDSDRAFAAGANFYLIKPARPVELTTSVRLMLGEPA
jgi:two-component system chemotaxis response regulator CheY